MTVTDTKNFQYTDEFIQTDLELVNGITYDLELTFTGICSISVIRKIEKLYEFNYDLIDEFETQISTPHVAPFNFTIKRIGDNVIATTDAENPTESHGVYSHNIVEVSYTEVNPAVEVAGIETLTIIKANLEFTFTLVDGKLKIAVTGDTLSGAPLGISTAENTFGGYSDPYFNYASNPDISGYYATVAGHNLITVQTDMSLSNESIDGLLFSSGIISTQTSLISGTLSDISLSSNSTMLLNEVTGGYYKGFFSVTIKSDVDDKWNFYLETQNSSSEYILYTASGSVTNQYGFYKENLELYVGTSDIMSYKIPGWVWAQTTSGNYSTPKIPVYFRKIG
jgi:hypothetical protein